MGADAFCENLYNVITHNHVLYIIPIRTDIDTTLERQRFDK